MAFDPDSYLASDSSASFDPDSYLKTSKPQSSGGWRDYVPDAIRDIPSEIYNAAAEGVSGVGNAWNSMRQRREAQAKIDRSGGSFWDPRAFAGQVADVGDVGGAAVHAASVPFAPLVGTARSAIGHPMADLTHAAGEVIAPDLAAKDDRQKMYENAKHDVDLALSAARPRGFTATGPIAAEGPSVLTSPEATNARNLASEFDLRLSRGQATGDLDRIRYEDMAARGAYGPEAQARAAQFFQDQFDDIQRGGRSVGQQFGVGEQPLATPADAASSLNADVAERALRARQLRDMAVQRAEQDAAAQRAISADQGRTIDQVVEGNFPRIESPRDAGEVVSQSLRDQAAAERAGFRDSYREAYSLPGEFNRAHFEGLGNRIRNDLTFADEPVVIDQMTPAASSALDHLNNIENLRIINRADPRAMPNPDDIAAVNLQGLDRARRVLQSSYRRAATPEDRRAVSSVISAFDGQVERSITEGLFSGDPRALEMLQRARQQFRTYQRRYSPQRPGDDVGTAMRRIIDRGATPEETANLIIGSGKIGATGLPVRIADRLEQTLGANSEGWNAIRQAMWRKASQVRNTAGDVVPDRSASSILDFTQSTLARRMFSPEELTAMRNHAQGVRDLERTIENLPSTRNAQRAQEVYQQAFGGDGLSGSQAQTFRRMVEGTATPEETAQTVFSVIAGGNPGNAQRALRSIEQIVGSNSPVMGAVRQGVWQKLTANPFGKDQQGQQKMVQGINEFLNGKGRGVANQLYSADERALMRRYADAVRKTIIPKYARTNSDTAVAWMAAARKYAGAIGSALGLGIEGGVGGGLHGYAVGKILDSAGKRIERVATMKRLNDSLEDIIPPARKALPSPKAKAAARTSALAAGSVPDVNIGRLLGQVQGPVPTRANGEQDKPERVGN